MAWSCRSHSPPWSQIGQSSGWLISRNSITPSRALRTIGDLVLITFGVPSRLGGRSRTPIAHDACGFGMPTTSIRHMRQLPAIDSRSWKQKRGISAPATSQACSSVYSGGTSISLPSTMSLVIAGDSGAARRFPQLCRGKALPPECVVARTVVLEMVETFHRLCDRGTVAVRHPPHHEVRPLELLEPFVPAAVEPLVHGLPDVFLERLDVLPDRHVDGDARIVRVRPRIRRIAAVVLVAPDETRTALGESVDGREIVHEVRHARIIDLVAQPPDVELRKVPRFNLRCHSIPLTPPPPSPDRDADSPCKRRCAPRSCGGNGAAGPAPARRRRRRRRRWCGPRSGW